MYCSDYDEYIVRYADRACYPTQLPPFWNGATATRGRVLWNEAVDPYVKNQQITTCPSLPGNLMGIGINYNHVATCGRSAAGPSGGTAYTGLNLALVKVPAQTMVLCDSTSALVYCRACWPTGPNATDTTNRVPLDRHNEGCNVGFLDGHAKWMKSTQLLNVPAAGTSQERIDFERLWGHKLD